MFYLLLISVTAQVFLDVSLPAKPETYLFATSIEAFLLHMVKDKVGPTRLTDTQG